MSYSQFSSVGEEYKDFKVLKVVEISELQCKLIELIHTPSGAQIMHIANDDPENLFCLSFQTFPNSSNGVAHILEHTVLCGSEKYPVKDPFFAMQRRSLNTFMNALTGSDFTCYPAASQVPKDFYNLLEVYLDAVFHPNLNEQSFLQEGHRLEYASPLDEATPLEFKGIVYNEMKGALSAANARLAETVNHALFPNLTYGYNSGGDPKEIISLSYKELCDFHKTFYHPSRCLFFFYGNLPIEKHLDFISEKILKYVQKMPPLPPLPKQPRFSRPKAIQSYYPISPEDDSVDQTIIAFAWLTCHILEQEEILALLILEITLMENDASPLKRALLNSKLCKQASCYLEVDITEAPLVISLKGSNPESADKLEKILKTTLEEIAEKGISSMDIENAMHQLEFHRSEITGDHTPFGLSLFMRAGLLKQHGGNPEDGLKIHSLFETVRKKYIDDPSYFSKIIRKYLLENTHFVRIVLTPSKELASIELKEERDILEKIQQKLTKDESLELVKQAKSLIEFQEKQENVDLNILPKISLEDVEKKATTYPLIQEKVGNLHVFSHACFTNEIVYADLIFPLPEIKEEELSLFRLFTLVLPQMGCGRRPYEENLEYIQANTGGVGASLTFNPQASDHRSFFPSLYLRGKALYRKSNKLFPLLQEMASSVDFTDAARLKEVVHKHFTMLHGAINQNALKYAINLSAKGLDVASSIANLWYGLDYYQNIKQIAEDINHNVHKLIEQFQSFQSRALRINDPHLVITCDESKYNQMKRSGFYGLGEMETQSSFPWNPNYLFEPSKNQGRVIAAPIAFIAKVFKTVSYSHPSAAALNIAAFLFDNLTLHSSIRERGGAYGGGAVCNCMLGTFYFYSYRDPNISKTLEAFHEAVQEVVKGNFDESNLEEAILEMIQGMDSPVSPGSRGDLAYGWFREGKTPEMRQRFRESLLNVRREDVISAVKEFIEPNLEEGSNVIFAGKELLEKENSRLQSQGKAGFSVYALNKK